MKYIDMQQSSHGKINYNIESHSDLSNGFSITQNFQTFVINGIIAGDNIDNSLYIPLPQKII